MTHSTQRRRSWRCRGALAALVVFGIGLTAPAEAVRRREQENPIQNAPEEEKVTELNIAPPPYPSDSKLAEIELRNQTTNKFFIDTSSLSVAKDRIIRFVMVVRTPTGETNVRFSGLRCREREWKDYAFARDDHTWALDENAQWRKIQQLRVNDYQRTLYEDYFCEGGVLTTRPAGDAGKLIKVLKNPPKRDPRVPRKE